MKKEEELHRSILMALPSTIQATILQRLLRISRPILHGITKKERTVNPISLIGAITTVLSLKALNMSMR